MPRARNAGRETALLLQPNISETEQWTAASQSTQMQAAAGGALAARRACRSRGQPPSIIVWPEVPAPLYYYEDARFRELRGRPGAGRARVPADRHRGAYAAGRAAQLGGAGFARRRAGEPLRQGEPGAVRRVRAVAVRVREQDLDRDRRLRGGQRVVVSPVGDHKIGTFICYESVFPNFVRKFAAGGAEVLFNISNDGWFGKSAARDAAPEHGAHARRGEPPLDPAIDQRRHHRDHRFGRATARNAAVVRGGDVVHGLQLRSRRRRSTRDSATGSRCCARWRRCWRW